MAWAKAVIYLVLVLLSLNSANLIWGYLDQTARFAWFPLVTNILALAACLLILTKVLRARLRLFRTELFSKHADLTDLAVAVVNRDKRIIYANRKASQLVGLSRESIVGRAWSEFIPSSVGKHLERIFDDLMDKGTPLTGYYECPVLKKDGSQILVAWHNTLILDKNGKVVATVCTGEDITQRRRTENHLKYVLSAVESSPNCVLITDSNLIITYASQAASRLLNYHGPEDLKNRSVRELICHEDIGRFEADLGRSFSESSPRTLIYRMLRQNGEKLPCEVSWSPMADADGELTGFVISVRDASQSLATQLRLKLAARLGSDITYEWDLEKDKIVWYGDITRLLGCSINQVPRDSKSWLSLIHPEDRPSVEEILNKRRTSADLISCEYRIMHGKGHWLHWLDKGQAIVEDGKNVRWISICTDITSQRKTEAALRRSEEKYRLVSENIPVVVYSTKGHPSEGCIFVSGRVQELTGYSGSEFIMDPGLWSHIIHPEDRERVISSVSRRLQSKAPINEEYRIVTRSGRTVWVRYKAIPMLDKEGSITRVDGFIEDISDRKLAEIGLQKSEEELRIAHRIASSFLTKQDDETFKEILSILMEAIGGRWALLAWNDEQGSLVTYTLSEDGFEKETFAQKPISSLHPPWRDVGLKVAAQAYEATLFAPDGRTMLNRAVIAPLIVKAKQFGIVGVAGKAQEYSERDCELLDRAVDNLAPLLYSRLERDAKELERLESEEKRKQMEERIFHIEKMESLGQLAGGIAHEFNNLLATIRGYTELLLSKVSKEGSLASDLKQIKKASDRAADLTRQLLLFGRSHPMESRLIDINSIINGMYRMLTHLIGENIRIETRLDPQIWRIKGDRRNIEQVIMNLVLNCKDAMPEGGQILIETMNSIDQTVADRGDSQYVCLMVKDNGKGMDDETLKHLFEPFYRSKATKKASGLGLAVVHGIVDQHRGKILVESELGKGTTFKIFFPAVIDSGQQVDDGGTIAIEDDKPLRVLVIEDEEPVMLLMERVLSENGFEVSKASSCYEARQVFENKKGEFDVLVIDMVLPDGNGVELAEELMSKPGYPGVVLTSGYINGSYDEIADRGFTFLSKPFSVIELLQATRKAAKTRSEARSEEVAQLGKRSS